MTLSSHTKGLKYDDYVIRSNLSSAQLLALSLHSDPRVPRIYLTLVEDEDDAFMVKTFYHLTPFDTAPYSSVLRYHVQEPKRGDKQKSKLGRSIRNKPLFLSLTRQPIFKFKMTRDVVFGIIKHSSQADHHEMRA